MPFRPSCCICVSDCDANGLLTNCQHFLCSRCSAKYPSTTCPRCQKPCKTIKLNADNFPRDISERMQCDPIQQLKSVVQSFEFQQRQNQVTHVRMREILVGLTGNNQQLQQRCHVFEKEAQVAKDACSRLTQEIAALKSKADPLPSSPAQSVRSSPFRPEISASCNNVFWTASPGNRTPLGWGRTKRDREDNAVTPVQATDPFRLSTPAVATVLSLREQQNAAAPTHRLQSLLPQQRVIHSSSGHHGDPFSR